MVLGMGGIDSEHYRDFKKMATEAFLHLRKYRNYFINIFYLMIDASIPDLPLERDPNNNNLDYKDVLENLNDRFLPGLDNEEARHRFNEIIDTSVNNLFAGVYEIVH
jgi:phosphatidylinositol 3-kinase